MVKYFLRVFYAAFLDKRKNMVSIFGRIAQLQNLLELSIADSTPESIDQLARGTFNQNQLPDQSILF